jgi:hypothetical protein
MLVMKTSTAAVAALACSLLLIPVMIDQADAGRRGGGGFSRGHIGGGNIARAHIAGVNRWSGNRWRGGNIGVRSSKWHGNNWKPYKHYDRRFVGVGVGWWPGYRRYSYGYGSCEALRRQAVTTGSRYWWNRYNVCVNY